MREKLINLLMDMPFGHSTYEEEARHMEDLADYLIANGGTVQQWIPVTERLPEEHDSIFTSFHGTEKWQDGMFLKCSDTVLASVEYEDCKRRVKAIVTKDGKWDLSKMYRASKVTHWMPLRNRRKRADHENFNEAVV